MHNILGILIVTLTSTPFLGFSYLEHISFITNNLHQMCLMLDQLLLGHSSRYCDISCSIFFSFTTGVELPLLPNGYSKRVFVSYCICVTSFFKHAL